MPPPITEVVERFSSRLLAGTSAVDANFVRNKAPRRRSYRFTPFLFIADIAITAIVYFCIVSIRDGALTLDHFAPLTLLLMIAAQLFTTATIGAYSMHSDVMSARYLCEHLISSLAAFLTAVTIIYFFWSEPFSTSRTSVFATMTVTSALTLGLRRFAKSRSINQTHKRVLLVIGDNTSRDSFVRWMKIVKSDYIVYFINSRSGLVDSINERNINMLGATIEQAISRLDRDLEAIVIAGSPDKLSVRFQNHLVSINFSMAPVYTLESFYAREWQTVPLSTLSAPWALNEGFNLSRSETYARIKRLYDLALAVAALLVLSPLFAIIAAIIKLDSKGTVIFKQERIGLQEKPFTLFKFRTMREGSENGALYTSKNDPRITAVGAFLRKTRLDEIPQFFNVLRGDMSLIGPRAEWSKLVRDYERLIPYYHMRHLVKPGITGWAQVNYSYGANMEDTQVKLRYDLYYVRYFSFMLDLNIMVKTIYVMLFGKGR